MSVNLSLLFSAECTDALWLTFLQQCNYQVVWNIMRRKKIINIFNDWYCPLINYSNKYLSQLFFLQSCINSTFEEVMEYHYCNCALACVNKDNTDLWVTCNVKTVRPVPLVLSFNPSIRMISRRLHYAWLPLVSFFLRIVSSAVDHMRIVLRRWCGTSTCVA